MRGAEVDQLYWTLGANMAPLASGIAAAQTKLGALSKFIKTPIGLFTTLGAVAAVAGIKATRMAAEFDKALRELSTLLPVTVDQMGELRDQIVKLSTEVPQAPAQLTQGMYEVVSAGITDTTEAFKVLEVASKAASAGLTETTTVVNALTAVMNSYGLGADQATRVSDVLFQTVNEGVIRFGELASQIGDVANTAALTGQPIEVVGAAIATMTQRGIMGAEAVTSLNRLLLALMDTESQGAAEAKKLGMEFGLAELKSKGLAGMMAELQRVTGGNAQAMALILPELRAFRAASVLAGTGVDQFVESIGRMENAIGTTEMAFKKNVGALGEQWKLLKNKVNVAWYTFGNFTLPVVAFWLEKVNGLLGATDDAAVAALHGLDALSKEGLDAAMRGAEATVARIKAEREAMERGIKGAPLMGSEFGRGDLADLDRQLTEAEARVRTLEALQVRRKQLAEEALGPLVAPGPQLPALETLEDHLERLEKRLIKIRDVNADVWNFDQYLANVQQLTQEMNAAADAAERMLMEQNSIQDAETKVLGLVNAWAAMPRSAETSQIMLETVRRTLAQTGKTIDDLTSDSLKRLIGMMEETAGLGPPMEDSISDVTSSVIMLSRTLIDAGRAFGVFGDSGAAALGSLANVAQSMAGLFGPDVTMAGKIQSIAGIVAGVLSLGKSMFGGKGPSPEEIARTEAIKQNSERLQELTGRIGELRDSLGGTKGGLVAASKEAIQAYMAWTPGTMGMNTAFGSAMDSLERVLKAAGFSLKEFEEMAEQWGIDLAGGTDALAQFLQVLNQIEASTMFETFAGNIDLIQREIDMFDVTDPIEKLNKFRLAMMKYGGLSIGEQMELGFMNLNTEEGRAALQKWVTDTFASITAGTFDLSKLGQMTFTQFLDWLSTVETLLDEDAVEEGVTNAFQVSRSITEVTGNRIAGIMTTVSYWQERTALGVEGILRVMSPSPVQAPTPSEMAAFMRGGWTGTAGGQTSTEMPPVVTVTWNGDIVVSGAADPSATARAVSTRFVDEVDRALGERMLEVRRARGLALPNGLRS